MNRLFIAGAAFLVLLTGATGAAPPTSIPWLSGTAPAPSSAKTAVQGYAVVRLTGVPSSDERAALQAGGMDLLAYVGGESWFARISPRKQSFDSSLIAGIGAIQPEWKLHPDLAGGDVPDHAMLPADADGDKATLRCAVYVCFFGDVVAGTLGPAVVGRHGGTVRSVMASLNALVVEIPCDQVAALASEDAVQWVEPALPQFDTVNDGNLLMAEVAPLVTAPYALDGTGISVMVYDAGVANAAHSDFGGRLTQRDTVQAELHPTHVAGTIAGDGSNSASEGGTALQWRGIAPGVTVESYSYEYMGSGPIFYTNPGDLEADYNEAATTYGADVGNNSLGSNVASNGYDCSLHGNYGVSSALIDSLVRTGIPQIWAAGNERGNGRCGTGYGTVGPPAGAKNAIIVGAVNSNDASMSSFSSWGPTDDGRLRPDICAPGAQIGGDGGTTSTSLSGAYTVMSGTSMATPVVTGICALLLQDYRAHYPGNDPSCATLKALLAHTATDLGNSGPDYQFGYGLVRARAAVDALREGFFLEDEINHGALLIYVAQVSPGAPTLRATLAWSDFPGTPNVSPSLVNDLDLTALSPSGVMHYPWTLDPANPGSAAVRTGPDRLNNIEQVVVDAPEAGIWQVRLVGTTVPLGPQAFSLVATPDLALCSNAGLVAFDAAAYSCSDSAGFSLVDCQLDASPGVPDTATVQVYSSSDPIGEVVTLTETGLSTGVFTGTVQLGAEAGFTRVAVVEGDVLTVVYDDADDGFGTPVTVNDDALIDCADPIISGVSVVPTATTARVSFSTAELARGEVNYGLLCSARTERVEIAYFDMAHEVTLSGLSPETTYYFSITTSDYAGNSATEANGGACMTFETGARPDYFSEHFDPGGFDLSNHMWILVPNASPSGYLTRVQAGVGALPTDPAGGTALSLADDDSAVISLTGGKLVELYEAHYDRVWVGSNGYVTLGGSDIGFADSLEAHFSMARISGLFLDFDPTAGSSQVLWEQTDDLLAVTWLEVQQWDEPGTQNTFQIRMHFDGRIDLTWLRVDSLSGLVGISAGGGAPLDFQESDISAYDAPGLVLHPIGNRQAYVDLPLAFEVRADSDAATPELSAANLPGDASFTDHGDGTGTFAWTPIAADLGNHPAIGFSADDTVQVLNEEIAIDVSLFTNAAPSAGNLTVLPAEPVTTDDLTGSYTYSDPESDPEVGTAVRWIRDGMPVESLDGRLTVPAENTQAGESWVFSVQPRDGVTFGDVVLSDAVTIIPSLDLNGDGNVNVVDVQLIINAVLGISSQGNEDVNGDGNVNAIDVQLIINGVLGIL